MKTGVRSPASSVRPAPLLRPRIGGGGGQARPQRVRAGGTAAVAGAALRRSLVQLQRGPGALSISSSSALRSSKGPSKEEP
jgi:hypothetical protein